MNRRYKIIAIAIAISLLVSSMVYYFQYVNIQNNSNVFHIQGILSVYKNGKLVHQGPDLLTNYFYSYLPFLLGDVCNTNPGSNTNCPTANFASNAFTFPPPIIGCILSPPFNPSNQYPGRVPMSSVYATNLYVAVGNGNGVSQTDCALNTVQLYQSANIYVYSPFKNNPNGAPFPCPNPTSGCVQVNTTFTATATTTLSEAMLYALVCSDVCGGATFTLIAHDTFSQVTLNQGDTLTITYTFIFPPIPTNVGAYNENQGAIAALFAQCLGRSYFGIGPSTARLCMDGVLPQTADIFVFQPANPCNDMIKPPAQNIINRSATISILTSSASKYVKIMAPMFATGSGTQIVVYNITVNNNAYKILEASQSCQVATMNNFTRGQSVGIQLNFP